MLVRIRYSHALRFVPSRNWWKERVRLRVHLLHQVLGVGRVPRHAQRRRVHLVEEVQRVPLEARAALRTRLVLLGLLRLAVFGPCVGPGDRTHLLRCCGESDGGPARIGE